MIKLLTSEEYHINFQKDGNKFERNSGCSDGGNEITVTIANPDKDFVTGVKITLIPYIPDQEFGRDQFFEPIEKEDTFDENDKTKPSISSLSVNPEFSYLISAAYITKYGYLSPSDNVTSMGEFEKMMEKHVGCYIQNDFYFKDEPITTSSIEDSSIRCATVCFKNENCTQGWSYQQATRRCLFIPDDISTEKIDLLQPNSHIMETERTVGWATGLKACFETGRGSTHCAFICLVVIYDVFLAQLMRTEDGVSGKMKPGKMAVGLRKENVTILHSVEQVYPVREMKVLNLTPMEVGLSGRIRPGKMAVRLGKENATILHNVEQDWLVLENQSGKVMNVHQVIRSQYLILINQFLQI